MKSNDDTTILIRISNLLHGSRGPIPELFYRTFEGTPFDVCTYCGTQLRSPEILYRISKLFCEGDEYGMKSHQKDRKEQDDF